MYNTLSIKVEIMPDSPISKVACDMLELAKTLDILVEANFNGCNLYVTKTRKYQDILDGYDNYVKHVAKHSLDTLV